jgi:hypothetical protein
MKWTIASLVGLLAVGMLVAVAGGVTIGVGVGYEVTGLILINAMTELPIADSLDVRAQVGFATPDIAGLMIVTMDVLAHWPVEAVDPYIGLGAGAALTPPPFSTGLVVEGIAGLRAAPFDIVQFYLQVRYLLRRSGVGWNAGPVFEVGLLIRF